MATRENRSNKRIRIKMKIAKKNKKKRYWKIAARQKSQRKKSLLVKLV